MNNIVDEIVSVVLRDNLKLLKMPPSAYESIMVTYGNLFWDKLSSSNLLVSQGLKIGLTKRYLEFSLKKLVDHTETKVLDNLYKKLTPSAMQCAIDSIESNTLVYIAYRNLKKTIDKVFEETGVC